MKVETHNHPTAISPFPGAATGSGGEIRDEGATGRGAKPKAGLRRLLGLEPAHPRCRAALGAATTASRSASPRRSTIMLEGPIGARGVQQRVRPPQPGRLLPHLRGATVRPARAARLPQADHDRRRPRQHPRPARRTRPTIPPGAAIVVLGGPAMLIGLGGGAASSHGRRAAAHEDLDFASVQRGNPEMQRRCQEVIDRCWALRRRQPDPARSTTSAPAGCRTPCRRSSTTPAAAARFDLRAVPNDEPGMSPLQIWCNEAQERYVLAIAAGSARRVRGAAASASAARIAVDRRGHRRRPALRGRGSALRQHADRHAACDVLLGKPPRMTRDVTRA
ncbi:MAG: hypothetical protein MZV65_49300 [Chromatiales bacterium]|nr:hypothetical protein [Chromatiales bacterium]